ncbi:MAG TPA: alpha/beta hydrolase, partial [Acidimicrobiales bacterium]|nr:alpha/beta hydrolase [Acidimicrobiales bacterium]
ARDVGMVDDPLFPSSFDAWSRELRELRAVACAPRLAPRPLLVVHGSEDDLVPAFDARVLVDAHGKAELRLVDGAGHRLRHDPRAVAVLLGWLDRQRNRR